MKKKVIQIGGNLRINGISSFIMTLYRNLHNDYQFIFINTASGDGFYRKEIEALGGKIYDVTIKGKALVRSLQQARAIRKIIKEEKPCAVHSHYYSNNGIYLKQAYKEKVPVRISHCHQSNPDHISFGKKAAKHFSARMIAKYATKCFGCSEKARQFLYSENGEVLYNAINYSKFCKQNWDLVTKYALSNDRKYFIFVGRYAKQKNIDFLLQVCERVKEHENIGFIFVGHGNEQTKIESFIKEKKLNNVSLFPADSDIAELMTISTAILLPSLYEGLPITLIEAQAVGIRGVVSNNVTKEVDLGLLDYLDLDVKIWTEKIVELANEKTVFNPQKSIKFDDKCQAAIIDGIYNNITSDEWILRGKEYSIGSKRFMRSKEVSQLCFEVAHRQGNLRGTFYYALGYFEGNGTDKDIERANALVTPIVAEIERHSISGKDEFMVILADMYSFGLGKKQDFAMAFSIYKKAAEKGNLEAMCDLGYMYLVGQGVDIDMQQSFYWYKKSADLGYVHSMRDVGRSFLLGEGTGKDFAKAIHYFSLASQHNYSHGTGDLAYCYLHGIGIEINHNRAKELLILALKQDAERTMRDLFAYGINVKKLKEEGELEFLHDRAITEISEQNTYSNTLCLNENIEKIDASCLYNSDVKKIFVEKGNQYFCSVGGVLFNKEKTILVRFPVKASDTVYTIPNGVKIIGKHAFQNCKNLTNIILPGTIENIEESAFDDCKKLLSIKFPSSVITIGDWAFHGCDKLTAVIISKNTTHIGVYAFGSCESLTSITVEDGNPNYISIDEDLYTADKSTLLQYGIGKKTASFILPPQTLKVAFRAFSDAYYLKEINLNNVKEVGEKAFYYATSLKRITHKPFTTFGENAIKHTAENLMCEVAE